MMDDILNPDIWEKPEVWMKAIDFIEVSGLEMRVIFKSGNGIKATATNKTKLLEILSYFKKHGVQIIYD